MKKQIHIYLVLLWVIVFGAGCASQEPVMVFVTPTSPEITPTDVSVTATSTSTVTATPEPTVTLAPTVLVVTESGGQTAPTMTPLGSVLEPGYTLPPTSTPRPSETPPVSPTVPASETPAVPVTELPQTPAIPIPPVGALPNLDPVRMGIQLDPTLDQEDWNNALATIQNLGVRWLKVQVSWRQLQPNGPDEVSEDFRRLEIYLETAYNNGLDILISVAKAPDWARSNRNEDGPPDDPAALARFIDLMLREFGTSLDAIEVWNEPNLSREWQGTLTFDGAGYMQLFRPAYDAITAYAQSMVNDPQVPRTTPLYIITAGLAPTSDNTELGSRNDRSFLQEMYAAGLGNYSDIFVGLHPYGWWNPPDSRCCGNSERGWDNDPHFYFMDNVSDMRDIMVQNGHTEQRMFVTEFGYATWEYLPTEAPQAWMNYVSECQQGEYIVRAYEMAQSWDYMGPMILWNLNVANPVTVENRDEMAAYSMLVPLEPRERAGYWMIFDAVRPEIPGLESYSRCPGTTP
jgi:polysaccharide biosynthesis protein PslG